MEEGGSRKRKNNTEHSYIARSIDQTNRRIREAWDKQNNEIIKSYTGSRRKKKLSLSHDDNHVDNNLMMVIDDDNNNNNENNIIEDHVTFNGDEEGIIHLLKEVNDHEIINVDHQINSSSSSNSHILIKNIYLYLYPLSISLLYLLQRSSTRKNFCILF